MSTPQHAADASAIAREDRAAESRASILDAAEAVLLAEGADGLTIRKVSDRCGFSAPTLYHHFGDKTGLLDAVLEARFAVVLRLMQSIARSGDPAQDVIAMARAFVRFALDNPDHYRLLTVPRLDDDGVPSAEAARALVNRSLEDLAREGALATPNIEEAFDITWAVLHGIISLYLLRPSRDFSPDLIERALDVLRVGLLRNPQRAPSRNTG